MDTHGSVEVLGPVRRWIAAHPATEHATDSLEAAVMFRCALFYVAGALDEATAQLYEQHFMQCARCLYEVEVCRALRIGIRARGRGRGVLRTGDT